MVGPIIEFAKRALGPPVPSTGSRYNDDRRTLAYQVCGKFGGGQIAPTSKSALTRWVKTFHVSLCKRLIKLFVVVQTFDQEAGLTLGRVNVRIRRAISG